MPDSPQFVIGRDCTLKEMAEYFTTYAPMDEAIKFLGRDFYMALCEVKESWKRGYDQRFNNYNGKRKPENGGSNFYSGSPAPRPNPKPSGTAHQRNL